MNTNIDIDEELILQVKRLTGLKTKREVVERALQTFVGLHDQSQVRLLRGTLRWEGDLPELRRVRDGDPG
jgi:Arc/MetJ family transcription regulator